jgi:hypothetical protein
VVTCMLSHPGRRQVRPSTFKTILSAGFEWGMKPSKVPNASQGVRYVPYDEMSDEPALSGGEHRARGRQHGTKGILPPRLEHQLHYNFITFLTDVVLILFLPSESEPEHACICLPCSCELVMRQLGVSFKGQLGNKLALRSRFPSTVPNTPRRPTQLFFAFVLVGVGFALLMVLSSFSAAWT